MNLNVPHLIHFILLFSILTLILIISVITNQSRYESYKSGIKLSKTNVFLTFLFPSSVDQEGINSDSNQFKKDFFLKKQWHLLNFSDKEVL